MPNEPCGDSVCIDRLDLEYLETYRESYIMANAERNALREQVEALRSTLAATEQQLKEAQAGAATLRDIAERTKGMCELQLRVGPFIVAPEGYQQILDRCNAALDSTSSGRDFLTRYNEAMGLLREFISEQATCLMATPCLNLQPLADRINAYLKGGERVG